MIASLLICGWAAAAEVSELEQWAQDQRLDTWWERVETQLQDPERRAHLVHQLQFESAWQRAFRDQRRPVVHLVDVVSEDEGWLGRPLGDADVDALERALRRYTGRRVRVELRTESAVYQQAFADHFRPVAGGVTVTATSYRSPTHDPAVPTLYTFAAWRDAEGTRVLVSASGGRVDEGAWVGSAARPIDDTNAWLYAHELFHSLGVLHHYASGLYRSVEAKADAEAFLVGSDCIMSAGYVGGLRVDREAPTTDATGRRRMADLACPICRFLGTGDHRSNRRWSRTYRREALWLAESRED